MPDAPEMTAAGVHAQFDALEKVRRARAEAGLQPGAGPDPGAGTAPEKACFPHPDATAAPTPHHDPGAAGAGHGADDSPRLRPFTEAEIGIVERVLRILADAAIDEFMSFAIPAMREGRPLTDDEARWVDDAMARQVETAFPPDMALFVTEAMNVIFPADPSGKGHRGPSVWVGRMREVAVSLARPRTQGDDEIAVRFFHPDSVVHPLYGVLTAVRIPSPGGQGFLTIGEGAVEGDAMLEAANWVRHKQGLPLRTVPPPP